MTSLAPAYLVDRLSVAPMLDWTDRHCRYFHRLLTRQTMLYTEMITAAALIRGNRESLLTYHPCEHPITVQLGGSDPTELAQATRLCADHGYDRINLNVGCPSDRVQSGCFGAVLMLQPDLVAKCVLAMQDATSRDITVKCRIGVDDQDPHQILPAFLEKIQETGCRHVIIHARKAWLLGLSPKENREIPPLDYDLVLQMKTDFPAMHISINGGIETLNQAKTLLDLGLDGVMIGRAAYHHPHRLLHQADQMIYGVDHPPASIRWVIAQMQEYIENHLAQGGRLHNVTRHMLGLFSGQKGARFWRRSLSEAGQHPHPSPALLDDALRDIDLI